MTIADNRKAFLDYLTGKRYKVGMAFGGWEVKATRASRAQTKEGYVVIRSAELFLIGAHISPLQSASTHVHPDPAHTRKPLLHAEGIEKSTDEVERRGYTLVPLSLHYTCGRVKCEIGFAESKELSDKRETKRDRDRQHEKARLIRERA